MLHRRLLLIVGALAISLALVVYGLSGRLRSTFAGSGLSATGRLQVVQRASYEMLTRQEMIEKADLIFLGRVVALSPTRWNQDSGEIWQDDNETDDFTPLQIHEITLEVMRPIRGDVIPGSRVTVTQIGASPLDGQADHHLTLGTEAVVYLSRTRLVWRDGYRDVLVFTNAPYASADIRGPDGLFLSPSGKPMSLEDVLLEVKQTSGP